MSPHERRLLLAECGRPATRRPVRADPDRGLVDTPSLDRYDPAPGVGLLVIEISPDVGPFIKALTRAAALNDRP
ncbi:hypothetical protein [Streptomyces chryseus]|uniref:hypothetical protein n=1 Tax=Streptomyces chryseus TaxID=68186 RepID=UPI00110FD8DF|nr:hypothetical protein [Streptomyces chryseus]GGX02093.1 hypothetical protein GCM10010353_17190 [Streptomyces chryseus]